MFFCTVPCAFSTVFSEAPESITVYFLPTDLFQCIVFPGPHPPCADVTLAPARSRILLVSCIVMGTTIRRMNPTRTTRAQQIPWAMVAGNVGELDMVCPLPPKRSCSIERSMGKKNQTPGNLWDLEYRLCDSPTPGVQRLCFKKSNENLQWIPWQEWTGGVEVGKWFFFQLLHLLSPILIHTGAIGVCTKLLGMEMSRVDISQQWLGWEWSPTDQHCPSYSHIMGLSWQ